MSVPVLISADWGTTALRCALLDGDGCVLDRRDQGPGILAVGPDGFARVLEAEIGGWLRDHGPLPVLMSGMIGSRQGWVEAPYLACPVDRVALAGALTRIGDAGIAGTGAVHIVPGVMVGGGAGRAPDVMRGEETQIVGALESMGDGLFVLPGTHSKWADVADGAITDFATYMTGEVFAALRQHTILGRLMPEGAHSEAAGAFDAAGFERGVRAGAEVGHPGALLQRVFAVRTLGLFDELPADALESYLSGLLIGAEMAAAGACGGRGFTIVGGSVLAGRYARAAAWLGLVATVADADCAARGHWRLAQAAGVLV